MLRASAEGPMKDQTSSRLLSLKRECILYLSHHFSDLRVQAVVLLRLVSQMRTVSLRRSVSVAIFVLLKRSITDSKIMQQNLTRKHCVVPLRDPRNAISCWKKVSLSRECRRRTIARSVE